ncbi:RHS repeat-associated core domain-containing protein [Maridesulfovibrio ferrireducens]|uniref:RHS repeat-associated core domain-containing protein n=1 Tax=Maridesulfovibrio ferrireducens TaxID=246191 RepID=A0A1G9KI10_9BACT|nr:RHS repeat-associated core domain-containing protein [Maridesulfovibrio ferrireducens]SDL49013.1 RHS repeat-associated core domain-containing protein [Maridesulfovibrio ferrireducens]
MNRLNSYWLRKKDRGELSAGARLYGKSMKPEAQLEEMYEVMQNVGLGEELDPEDMSSLFAEFSNDEKMYPSMMPPERRSLWEQRKRQMEQIQERQKNAKRQLHAQFMMKNPELPLAQELRKTEYGQELLTEIAMNQPRQPETGTGQNIVDEQKRDSVDMEAVEQFETKPFIVPGMEAPFSLLATERDENGRIIQKALALAPKAIMREYEYDNGGRLSKVLCDESIIEQYQYGKYGERLTSETRHTKPQLLKYNSRLQLIADGNVKYFYDNQGRMIEKNELGKITRYSYLESGPLHEVVLPDGRRVEYTSDPAGKRISKSINGKTVEKYLWQDLTTLIAVTDAEGLRPKVFTYDEEGDPVAMTYEGKTFYFATDQVGSIFMVADERGNEVKRIIYDSFGNLLFDSNEKFDTCVGFSAGLIDKDTGLIHFGYREYDPAIGRFITPDPIGFAGGDVDVYGFCLDDPINFVDRTGLAQVYERRLKGLEFLDDSVVKNLKKALKRTPQGMMLAPFEDVADQIVDAANIKLKHEYIKYDKANENKGEETNSGFSKRGIIHDETGKDTPIGKHYDDVIMRQAEKNIDKTGQYKKGKYIGLGHNCQSYTEAVAEESSRLQQKK